MFISGRNEVVAKVMFLLVSVILLTGGSASVHAGIPPPRKQTPPGNIPPQEGGPPSPWKQIPQEGGTPPDTVDEQPVRILLECILVYRWHHLQKSANTSYHGEYMLFRECLWILSFTLCYELSTFYFLLLFLA